jgi:serine/threonine protein kinase
LRATTWFEGLAGKGGMGFVYRTRDLKLGRTVALKFLPSEVSASDREKQRFLTEARLAAALDHPNIGSIYGIDVSVEGRTFIVMAYYGRWRWPRYSMSPNRWRED